MSKLSFILTILLSIPAFSSASKLSKLNIDSDKITISGISSGAFMAVQMGVAYSDTFSGVASIAGGIYSCAQGQAFIATEQCMKNPDSINVDLLVQHTKKLDKYRYIDSTENLKKQRIYIFSSVADSVVKSQAGEKLQEFYSHFTSLNQITLQKTPATEHGFPTLSRGAACDHKGLPWILNCGFDMAGTILKNLYGKLKDPASSVTSSLKQFSQTAFGGAFAGLESHGWIYIPTACQHGHKCKLHIALHGCQMSSSYIQDQFVSEAGYNEWAETNRIVVLYPQALKNNFSNPNGCWDWFGYTGLNYATQYGTQMSALRNMIERLQGK